MLQFFAWRRHRRSSSGERVRRACWLVYEILNTRKSRDWCYIPVEIALRIEPWDIEPDGKSQCGKFLVVFCYVRMSIIGNRTVWKWDFWKHIEGLLNLHLNCRLCWSSYFSVARPSTIFLPSACLASSLMDPIALWTSSMAPVYMNWFSFHNISCLLSFLPGSLAIVPSLKRWRRT